MYNSQKVMFNFKLLWTVVQHIFFPVQKSKRLRDAAKRAGLPDWVRFPRPLWQPCCRVAAAAHQGLMSRRRPDVIKLVAAGRAASHHGLPARALVGVSRGAERYLPGNFKYFHFIQSVLLIIINVKMVGLVKLRRFFVKYFFELRVYCSI